MLVSASLEMLREAASLLPGDWAARYPGYRGIGTLCSYVPEELLHAAGFIPVRLRGTGLPIRRADSHLPSYTCALCRSTLDQLLLGDLSDLAGLVFAHTCDTMQALADLSQSNANPAFWVETVVLPARLDSEASSSYLIAELAHFRERLTRRADRPVSDKDLLASIELYDESRRLVQALALHRDRLSATDFFAVLDAAQVMPRNLFNSQISGLLREVETWPLRLHRTRLFLSGAVLDDRRILELIDALGAQVAGDDLCSGSRHFLGQAAESGDPLHSLARYFLRRLPCPCKRHSSHDASRSLLDQVRTTHSEGVLFLLAKYCEPHAFEEARLRAGLEQAGVPYLVLEMEQSPNIEGLRTRLQAFLETL